MEKYTLAKDLYMLCVRATHFPEGISEAFQKLKQTDALIAKRVLYGISHGSDNGIMYWAAAEEAFKGEAYTFGLEQYTIKKGVYEIENLTHVKGKEELIGKAFDKLLRHPKLDPLGECIEHYKSENEVVCMVRILE
jgi:hypothetical protein